MQLQQYSLLFCLNHSCAGWVHGAYHIMAAFNHDPVACVSHSTPLLVLVGGDM
jgi:hypothetical protein